MSDYQVTDINITGIHLFVITVNLEKKGEMNDVSEIIKPLFSEIVPFLIKTNHVMYIRDIKKFCIDSTYPAGDTYVGNEVKIAIPQWPVQETDIRGTIAHELHHVGRWQTVGYGKTLGEAIASEGLAQLYAFKKTGKLGLWSRSVVSDEVIKKAGDQWNSEKYSHKEWFFKGSLGKWLGYAIGYRLAMAYYKNVFDLSSSFKVTAKELKKFLR